MLQQAAVDRKPVHPLARARAALKELHRRRAKDSLALYCGLMIPSTVEKDEDMVGMEKRSIAARYVPAEHHRLLISKLEALERGYVEEDGERIEFKRLMVFMPPGSAKSTYGSVMYPAWYLGRHPRHCLIQGSYNADLAGRFGRRARNTYSSPEHQSVFGIPLGKSAESEWETALGGEYFSFGMKTGVTGRRADGVIIDDAIKGRKEADSETERNNVWETYKADVRTRMKPNAWVLYIATRWHEDDPAGRILPTGSAGKSGWFTAQDGERWYVLSLNAVIESEEEAANDPLGRSLGDILWPEWFTERMLLQERRTQGSRNWWALYKQMPRAEDGGIIKRTFWRKWPGEKPPKCEYVISVYDTAFEEEEQNDYSARTSWGVFWHEELPPKKAQLALVDPLEKWKRPPPPKGRYCAILLDSYEEKVEFPELRRIAKEHYKKLQPDKVLIEKKASGHSLIQELRRDHVPVHAVKADRSKRARAHAAAVPFEDGAMFYLDRKWAEHVIERTAGFPDARYNDIGDTVCHAAMWLRQRFFLQTKGELQDNDDEEAESDDHYHDERPRLYG